MISDDNARGPAECESEWGKDQPNTTDQHGIRSAFNCAGPQVSSDEAAASRFGRTAEMSYCTVVLVHGPSAAGCTFKGRMNAVPLGNGWDKKKPVDRRFHSHNLLVCCFRKL